MDGVTKHWKREADSTERKTAGSEGWGYLWRRGRRCPPARWRRWSGPQRCTAGGWAGIGRGRSRSSAQAPPPYWGTHSTGSLWTEERPGYTNTHSLRPQQPKTLVFHHKRSDNRAVSLKRWTCSFTWLLTFGLYRPSFRFILTVCVFVCVHPKQFKEGVFESGQTDRQWVKKVSVWLVLTQWQTYIHTQTQHAWCEYKYCITASVN